MANKNIKGITIKIGAETTELTKALKDVNGVIAKSNSELKNLNQALKLDPKNTELLSQKQEVLAKNIQATKDRLETLKEAQRQMGSYNSLTDEQKESYRALSVEISKNESALKGMNRELTSVSNAKLEGLQNALKKVGDIALDVSKKMLEVGAAVSTALAGVVAAGVKSYADYEQNVGGINKLFEDSADELIAKSQEAYKTAGLSANQYMETATSFSASLLKGLGGDTEAAVQLTDRAIRDMSDNANTFGSSMDEVMNVYKALSKEQYTTLDNLRLGYAGTKEGMKQLIADASTYTDIQEKLGITVDESSLSFDNIINAISVMQDHLNITGTTMNEAEGTITGSINSMKAAFDNFLNGSGSPKELANTVKNVLQNIGETITELAPNILQGIVELVQTLLPQVTTMIIELLPQLMDAVSGLIDSLLNLLKEDTEGISQTISDIMVKVVEFIGENLPKIIEAALIIMIALAEGLIDALPKLIEMLPKIIEMIVIKLTDPDMLAKIISVSLKLIVTLALGISKAIPELIKIVPTVINNFKDKLIEKITNTDWGKLGSDIIRGICDGFGRIGSYITNKVNEVKEQITSKFKSIFGIHSPSTLMRDTIGFNITAGIGEGIEEGVPKALKDVDVAMKQLNAGIEASVNPTINPSMTYESNYGMMAKAMKEALQDMTIELDDENVGKFVIKTVTEEVYS